MFRDVIAGLTLQQKAELDRLGVSKQLRTHWKSGRRFPTEVQVALLASVAGVDRHALQDEIALLRAEPMQRDWLLRAMGKSITTLGAYALGVGLFMAAVFAQPAWSHGANPRLDGDNV